MKANEFNELVSYVEGGKNQLSIAQIAEVTKIINKLTDGELYKIIRKLKLEWQKSERVWHIIRS